MNNTQENQPNIEDETASGYDYDTNPFPDSGSASVDATRAVTRADRQSDTCDVCEGSGVFDERDQGQDYTCWMCDGLGQIPKR